MKTFQIIFLAVSLLLSQQLVRADMPTGKVVGWGSNIGGEATGIPTGNPPGTPNAATGLVMIAGQVLSNVMAVSAGSGHSLALKDDGTVFGWGNNPCGEATGFKTEYPYRTNGQVKLAGQILTNITAISAGDHISLALKSDGTVVSWGEKPGEYNWGQMKVPSGLSNVVAIAAGIRGNLALKKDGTVVQWSVAGDVRPAPAALSNIVAIAAGNINYGHNLGLKRDGTVVKWTNGNIEEPVPDEATNVVSIASGDAHSLALRKDGTVVGWGSNQFGEATGNPTTGFPSSSSGVVLIGGLVLNNVTAIAAGNDYSLALIKDGTVVAWGNVLYHQVAVPSGLSDVVAIAAGQEFCLAITTNSAVATKFRQK